MQKIAHSAAIESRAFQSNLNAWPYTIKMLPTDGLTILAWNAYIEMYSPALGCAQTAVYIFVWWWVAK